MLGDVIRSRQNAHIKRLRALFARRDTDDAVAAIEGEHLLQEALRSGITLREVFLREDAAEKFSLLLDGFGADTVIHTVTTDVFDSVVATGAPQGVAAIVARPQHTIASALGGNNPLAVFLDGVQDPGNVGTILRSMEAFAATAVVALPGTVSPWNLKAIRASAGAIFRLPVFSLDETAAISVMLDYKLHAVAAVARGGVAPDSVQWDQPTALLIGSEGRGISSAWLQRSDEQVTIATSKTVESLNAAMAASLLLHEASKVRGNR